jgi:hypothetical protein
MPPAPEIDPKICLEQWTKHRKQTRIVWALFVGWIPYGIFVLRTETSTHSDYVGLALIPYVLVLMIVSAKASWFRCPRCRERFYAWGPWGLGHNGFARKCRNCGLRKWQCE